MARRQRDAEASAEDGPRRGEYDVFLSHATPDKAWVLTLAKRLEGLGLRVFVDALEIDPGDNWVIRLSDALERSRYLVLVLSNHTEGRPWVMQEWTSWMAGHGPLGRLLPVKIDAVDLPFILKATQAIDATHRDAQRTADALFNVVGDPAALSSDDARRLVLGRDLVFTLSRDDELTVVTPSGERRQAPLPWKKDNRFGIAYLGFSKLHREPVTEAAPRTELFQHARTLGSLLFDALFDETDAARLDELIGPDRPRPVIQVRSDDAVLLSLPWELLYHNDVFLVREGRIDLVRATPTAVAGTTLLKEPKTPFKLVVNVSAPEGSHLSYEAESYRITLATAEHCPMAATELGTLADLVETVDREAPTGVHFSGHGKPGALLFESDEGLDDLVPMHDVLEALRRRLPDDRRVPPFFYLATCHGNEPAGLEQHEPGSSSAAVQLHQEGVTEVVGYSGPIVDELSTRAEEALYEAIAEGLPTRDAVRRARDRLAQPYHAPDGRHRPSRTAVAEAVVDPEVAADTHPFAWAQLVLYRRGPEWPLSVPIPAGKRRRGAAVLRRTFEGFGNRRVLTAGFIGRRVEQHRVRRRLREGAKVLVFQGLGGLGKSTLAQQVLPWLTEDSANVCTLWCQEVEGEANRAEALVGQLLAYCRERFGLDWEGVVQQVDQAAGDDPAKRFVYFLQALVQNGPRLVLYMDNLESLLIGPKDEREAAAFGQWAEPTLETIWRHADEMARDSENSYLVASCRYRNDAFGNALLPVTPLPPDALFRLTEWFQALRRLTTSSRAQLIARLDGHPRAVEYANDLVADAFTKWRNTKGEWSLPEPPSPEDIDREWKELVAPALPKVAEKLKDNLLLQAIWDQVLDERAQRFLYRMTVLRRPVDWSLLGLLGEEDQPEAAALATAERLRDTSLLEQVELFAPVSAERIGTVTRYTLHPATVQFIGEAHPDAPALSLGAHRCLGEHLEAVAKDSPDIETHIEAGHHLFEAGEVNRACELLGSASEWLQGRGRVRESLRVLSPFLEDSVQARMAPRSLGQLLGTVGTAYARLGEVEKAIGYYDQALVVAREIGDRQGEGNSLGNLGIAHAGLGDAEKAIGYFERQLVIVGEIGDRQGEGKALGNLGIVYACLEAEKAIGYHKQALVIMREIGDRRGEGNALGNLGGAYARLGEVEKAIGYQEQALVIMREIGDRRGEGKDLGNLGIVYAGLGEVEKAIGYQEQALVIMRETGDRQGEGKALGNLGIVYARLGEVEKATALLQQAKLIGGQIGDPRIVQVATQALEELSPE